MSIIVTNGTVVLNLGKASVAITQKNGPQTLAAEVEARLVSEGVAQYVDAADRQVVATPPVRIEQPEPGDDSLETETSPSAQEIAVDKPRYSINLKAAELRELLEECDLPYKVGMTKAAMVTALDEYFEDAEDDESPPDLGAEEPII